MIIGRKYFKVFVKYIKGYGPDDWVETNRIVVDTFRRQMKGLGSAQFRVLPALDGELFSTLIREIIVVDNRDGEAGEDFDTNLGRILWRGNVTNSVGDSYKYGTNTIGMVFAEEYGSFVSNEAIISNNASPWFNAVYEDIQYGNYEVGNNFRNELFAQRSGVGTMWKLKNIDDEFRDIEFDDEILDEFVWNRKKIIQKLIADSKWVNEVVFPWETIIQQLQNKLDQDIENVVNSNQTQEVKDAQIENLQNNFQEDSKKIEDSYEWFLNFDIGEIDNFHDRDLIDALIELIPEPFDFYFDHNLNASGPELIIVNKSTIDLVGLGNAGSIKNIIVPSNDTDILRFNIRNEEIYDRVIVRSQKPILWTGTLTLDLHNIFYAPLKPGWTQDEEEQWIQGYPDDEEASADNPVVNESTRRVLDRVFQKFDWREGYPTVSNRALNVNESTVDLGGIKLNFFGNFFGIDLDPVTGDSNVFLDDPFIDVRNTNRTPNKLAQEWEPFLPFSRFDNSPRFLNVLQYNIESDKFASPFIVSKAVDTDGFQYYIDRSLPFGFASGVEVGFHTDGIWAHTIDPQTNLSRAEDLFRLELEGEVRMPPPTVIDLADIDNLEPNPLFPSDDLEGQNGFSSFWTYHITVAGRSNQYLEAYKWRRGPDGAVITGEKTKIVEVPVEMWLVHNNTVRNVAGSNTGFNLDDLRSNAGNSLIRFVDNSDNNERNRDSVHIVRDDRKLLLQYLEAYSAMLMQPRGEMNLTVAIDRNYDIHLGDLIGKAKDGNITHQVNSCVVAEEWSIENGPPRINFLTSTVTKSPIQHSLEEAHVAMGVRPPQKPNAAVPLLTPLSMPQIPRDNRIRRQ